MDILSVYACLQQNRKLYKIPFFTIEQFIQALKQQSPSDTLLLSIVFHQLMAKMGLRSYIRTTLQQSLTFYNNSEANDILLSYIQQFNEFHKLSVSLKIEIINQLCSWILQDNCEKYNDDGTVNKSKQQFEDRVDSFTSLGFDTDGNEYLFIYPNTICIYSTGEPEIFQSQINQIVKLSEYQVNNTVINKCTHEEYIYNSNLMNQLEKQQYKYLNDLLICNDVFTSDIDEQQQYNQNMQYTQNTQTDIAADDLELNKNTEKNNYVNSKQFDVHFPATYFYNFKSDTTYEIAELPCRRNLLMISNLLKINKNNFVVTELQNINENQILNLLTEIEYSDIEREQEESDLDEQQNQQQVTKKQDEETYDYSYDQPYSCEQSYSDNQLPDDSVTISEYYQKNKFSSSQKKQFNDYYQQIKQKFEQQVKQLDEYIKNKKDISFKQETITQLKFMIKNELSYQLLHANTIQYNQDLKNLQLNNITIHCLKVNPQILFDLINAIQFKAILFKQNRNDKQCQEIIEQCNILCYDLLNNYRFYQYQHQNNLKSFKLNENNVKEHLYPLNDQNNQLIINYQLQQLSCSIKINRKLKADIGNTSIIRNLPIFMYSKKSIPYCEYLFGILIHCGYKSNQNLILQQNKTLDNELNEIITKQKEEEQRNAIALDDEKKNHNHHMHKNITQLQNQQENEQYMQKKLERHMERMYQNQQKEIYRISQLQKYNMQNNNFQQDKHQNSQLIQQQSNQCKQNFLNDLFSTDTIQQPSILPPQQYLPNVNINLQMQQISNQFNSNVNTNKCNINQKQFNNNLPQFIWGQKK